MARHPDLSQPTRMLAQLTDGAVVTSAGCYLQGKHVVDLLTQRGLPAGRSITVVARRAIWADALIEVVHAQGPQRWACCGDDLRCQPSSPVASAGGAA